MLIQRGDCQLPGLDVEDVAVTVNIEGNLLSLFQVDSQREQSTGSNLVNIWAIGPDKGVILSSFSFRPHGDLV